ncbi:MAG: hypothetical protein B7X40_05960, partial [Cellulomonas sp. 14-74-6]
RAGLTAAMLAGCRGCELWAPARQVVFSSGDPDAPPRSTAWSRTCASRSPPSVEGSAPTVGPH